MGVQVMDVTMGGVEVGLFAEGRCIWNHCSYLEDKRQWKGKDPTSAQRQTSGGTLGTGPPERALPNTPDNHPITSPFLLFCQQVSHPIFP